MKEQPFPICILNGKPHFGKLPEDAKFIGMEKEPSKKPRYGELYHSWHNLPCYAEGEGR